MELVTLKSSSPRHLSPPKEFPVDWVGTSGVQLDSEHVIVCGGLKRGSVDMDSYCYTLKKTTANDATYFKNTGQKSLLLSIFESETKKNVKKPSEMYDF